MREQLRYEWQKETVKAELKIITADSAVITRRKVSYRL